MRAQEVIGKLRGMGDSARRDGMRRYGIATEKALGVSVPQLRAEAKKIGKDHSLAGELWNSGIHEARMLAAMIDDPVKVTRRQMDSWVSDFDSWDVCDCCCGELFDKTPYAVERAKEWVGREEEFVRRAGFVLVAEMAVHDKHAPDDVFLDFFDAISEGSRDGRNYVKKAVSWALRQIGKRNPELNRRAIVHAGRISKLDSPSARWVASDVLRELRSPAVTERLRRSS